MSRLPNESAPTVSGEGASEVAVNGNADTLLAPTTDHSSFQRTNQGADTLLALAGRAEAATGPDRELFVEAFIAVYGKASADRSVADTTSWIAAWGRFNTFLDVGAYLDAAMTLVPEGWRVGDLSQHDHAILRAKGDWTAWLYADGKLDTFNYRKPRCKFAATPARALCAAALRARAALASGVGE